jgi:hypothetical protein
MRNEKGDEKTLGQVGFEAYGEAGSQPWKTFDGRDMPRWEAMEYPAAALTKARWQAAADAIAKRHEEWLENERRWRWDAFAHRYVQVGDLKGPAINWNRTTGA